jgi:hypothetical protein
MAEVSEAELKEVLHSFQKDKSPGPDGWSMDFFVGLYDFFSSDLLKVIEESRINGFIHPPFNATFIALIPKQDAPESLDDYRPISLCNCIYKIIAKIISRRIKGILSNQSLKNNLVFWKEDRSMKQLV